MNETQKELKRTETELIKKLKSLLDDLSLEDVENGEGYYQVLNLTKRIVKTNQECIKTPWWSI